MRLSRFAIFLLFAVTAACSAARPPEPTVDSQALSALMTSALTRTPLATWTATSTGTVLPQYGPVVGAEVSATAPGTLPPSPTLRVVATDRAATPTYGPLTGGTATVISTTTPLPPTKAAIATSSAPTPTFGALIPPDYTPPPTATSVPTLPPSGTLPPVATAGPSPTPGDALRPDLMGVQIHPYLTDVQWSDMLTRSAELGVGWIKIQVAWREYEASKGQFSELYRAMVLNVQRARIAGFRTMLNVSKAPQWARPLQGASQEDGPPANPQDLADFVTALVRDIKPEFVDAIEIWNEPNLIREWRDKPISGAEYMRYFRAAYDAIVAEEQRTPSLPHRIMIITAGPAPTFTDPGGNSMDDRVWLQQLYDAGLAQLGEDVAIGAHPYGWVNSPDAVCCTPQAGVTGWYEHPVFYFRNTLEDYRAIMVRNGHAIARLWVTEFGWAAYDGLKRSDGRPAISPAGSGWQAILSQQQQAQYVLRAFQMAQQQPYYEYLGPMMLWNLNFATLPTLVDNSREEAGFSLLDQAGNPRPVFEAVKGAAKAK